MVQGDFSIADIICRYDGMSDFERYNYLFVLTNGFDSRSVQLFREELTRYLFALFKYKKEGQEHSIHEFAEVLLSNKKEFDKEFKDRGINEGLGFNWMFKILVDMVEGVGAELVLSTQFKNLFHLNNFISSEWDLKCQNITQNSLVFSKLPFYLEQNIIDKLMEGLKKNRFIGEVDEALFYNRFDNSVTNHVSFDSKIKWESTKALLAYFVATFFDKFKKNGEVVSWKWAESCFEIKGKPIKKLRLALSDVQKKGNPPKGSDVIDGLLKTC